MARRYPYKDCDYEATIYDTLASDQRQGVDISQRLADLIADTWTRPGFMATRLNRAGVLTKAGGRWNYSYVTDVKTREKMRRTIEGWSKPAPSAATFIPPPPIPDHVRREAEMDDYFNLPETVVGRRRLWNHIHS